MMAGKEIFSVPVVFADRFFMSERSLAEISSLGGFAWADAPIERTALEELLSRVDIATLHVPLTPATEKAAVQNV